ncbi:MAG: Omp28-related outer membrane protein [Calditrichia bacterium]
MNHATMSASKSRAIWIIAMLFITSISFAQSTVRNPVMEHCTGTWCQFCPAGDQIIENIKAATPNVIMIAYHGPSTSSDPFDQFNGNGIIGQMGFTAYPTACIDRNTTLLSRGSWASQVALRASTPATVDINVTRSYDVGTRTFDATIDFTALTNLNGNFRYSVVLMEDGLVWGQTGTGGGPNYIHYDTVRDMMNGANGSEVITGAWNQGDVVTKTLSRVVPVMPSPSPDIIPDSCHVAVFIFEENAIFRSSEIHQGVSMDLIAPDYLASWNSSAKDFLGSASATAQNTVVLRNDGLNQDTYTVGLSFDGPATWTQEFTTVNGTFPIGQTDQLTLDAGDSTIITVSVAAGGAVGYGRTSVEFTSQILPANNGSIDLNFTTHGVPILLVDDDGGKDYQDYLVTSLQNNSADYGVVTSSVATAAGADLGNYGMVMWMAGTTVPCLDESEMTTLKTYLDNGGGLYVSGLDLAYYMADPASGYSTPASQDFLTNYLHANYETRRVFLTIMEGVSGDAISDGIGQMNVTGGTGASTISFSGNKFANRIAAADGNASPVFSFFTRPTEYSGIKAEHNGAGLNGKSLMTTFGFESIAEQADRDLVAERIVSWLTPITGIGDDINPGTNVETFSLHGNYPNPFNPSTTIVYSLPVGALDAGASLVIYNQLGQQVRTMKNIAQTAGTHEVVWDARDDAGSNVASGIYIYRLTHGSSQASQKMLLLR